jgi:hypothetical protein
LAYLANLQGDSVALNIFKDGELFSMPSKPDPQHLQRLYYHLQQVDPAGRLQNLSIIKNFLPEQAVRNCWFL